MLQMCSPCPSSSSAMSQTSLPHSAEQDRRSWHPHPAEPWKCNSGSEGSGSKVALSGLQEEKGFCQLSASWAEQGQAGREQH